MNQRFSQSVSQLETLGPIDRTPGIPGSDKYLWETCKEKPRHTRITLQDTSSTNLSIEKVQISGGGAQTCKKVSVICKKSPVLAGDMEICE